MRFFGQFVSTMLVLAVAATAPAQTLQLGETASRVGGVAEVPLTLTSDQPVEGLVAAFGWDGAGLVGSGLEIAASIATADTVVTRVEDDYAVLGVVVDADGIGEDTIPPGADILLAVAKLRCTERLGATALVFEDGK